ncbi:hypothetical protein CRG98_005490 [Punica granatum]|uniref:Uncharacterized protein n=1 Tax=Punica granatum TaxID=22663 RepID=A0A2I0L057_PUNGR|nr:hypothetical protein CRG98_005490 [Punica granatum]
MKLLRRCFAPGVARCEWDPAFRGLNARPPGLLLALHGHIETFSKVPKRLYRLFDAPMSLGPFSSGCRRAAAFVTRMGNFCSNLLLPRSPRGVFDLAGLILLPLEFARAKGSNDSTSECITFRLRRGVASAAPLFVGLGSVLCPLNLFETPRLCIIEVAFVCFAPWRLDALLKPNVSCLGAYRCMLLVMGLCSGEGSICPEVSLDLGGDACVDVEWFVQLSLSPASWGVPIRRTTPSSKYEERVRDEFSRRCEPVYRSLPVTGVSL